MSVEILSDSPFSEITSDKCPLFLYFIERIK